MTDKTPNDKKPGEKPEGTFHFNSDNMALGHMEVVEGSGHFIQNDRPQAVVQAVLRLAQAGGADIARCRESDP
jgi:hypothetical protein